MARASKMRAWPISRSISSSPIRPARALRQVTGSCAGLLSPWPCATPDPPWRHPQGPGPESMPAPAGQTVTRFPQAERPTGLWSHASQDQCSASCHRFGVIPPEPPSLSDLAICRQLRDTSLCSGRTLCRLLHASLGEGRCTGRRSSPPGAGPMSVAGRVQVVRDGGHRCFLQLL